MGYPEIMIMSQTLVASLQSIKQWIEATVSSQDSYSDNSLLPDEIDILLTSFLDVFAHELKAKHILVMIKSTQLLLKVTVNMKVKKDKLSVLIEALMINLISSQPKLKEKWMEVLWAKFLIVLEGCLSDMNSLLVLFQDLSQRFLSVSANPNIFFWARMSLLESFQKYLVKVPKEERISMFNSLPQEFDTLVNSLYTCGDYYSQATIVAILMRFTNQAIRKELVNEWFPNNVKVQSLFLSIKDLESDCRNFLNHFNVGLGDGQLVFSHGMLSCVVEDQSLEKPGRINDFWVDFNKGSMTISFYYITPPSEGLFTMMLSRDDVKRILTKYEGGKLHVLISCDSSLNEDVKLSFLQPKNIPQLLKAIFENQLAEANAALDAPMAGSSTFVPPPKQNSQF